MTTSCRRARPRRAAWCLLGILTAACGSPAQDAASVEVERSAAAALPAFTQWRLPRELREISGLARTRDNRILAVADERALVAELDVARGKISKRFAFGNPAVAGDFEGIATVGTMVYLLTSDGLLLRAAEGADNTGVAFERFDTGLGGACEFEGLARDPTQADRLWLACKRVLGDGRDKELHLYAWSRATELADAEPLRIKLKPLRKALDSKSFNPSGLAFTSTGELVLVAARQESYALFSGWPEPALAAAARLPNRKRHPQTEGITSLDGAWLLADEGKKTGTLSRYARPFWQTPVAQTRLHPASAATAGRGEPGS
ncbi:MAG: hypothetical protein AAF515_07375 [Pseudomonadota bacterium]